MKLFIEIEMENSAFDESPASEAARIMRVAAYQVEAGELPPFTLRDLNGNRVGVVRMESPNAND